MSTQNQRFAAGKQQIGRLSVAQVITIYTLSPLFTSLWVVLGIVMWTGEKSVLLLLGIMVMFFIFGVVPAFLTGFVSAKLYARDEKRWRWVCASVCTGYLVSFLFASLVRMEWYVLRLNNYGMVGGLSALLAASVVVACAYRKRSRS